MLAEREDAGPDGGTNAARAAENAGSGDADAGGIARRPGPTAGSVAKPPGRDRGSRRPAHDRARERRGGRWKGVDAVSGGGEAERSAVRRRALGRRAPAPLMPKRQTQAPPTVTPLISPAQTLAPQTLAPQTLAPQTLAPQMVAPQMVAPQMVAPQMVAPQIDWRPGYWRHGDWRRRFRRRRRPRHEPCGRHKRWHYRHEPLPSRGCPDQPETASVVDPSDRQLSRDRPARRKASTTTEAELDGCPVVGTEADEEAATNSVGTSAPSRLLHVGDRPGIEVRLGLATLLGLDDHPAELPGWGPITAEHARTMVAHHRAAEWRFAVVNDHGYLILGGLLRARPGPPPIAARPRRRVRRRRGDPCPSREAARSGPLSRTFRRAGHVVVAEIARQYADRRRILAELDSRPAGSVPQRGPAPPHPAARPHLRRSRLPSTCPQGRPGSHP